MAPRALACAALTALLVTTALPADDAEKQFQHDLAVQRAFEDGLAALKRHDHAAAVRVLEKHVRFIDGNARYLAALRDAYRGHVKALQRAGKAREADLYRTRLAILEPTTTVDVPTALSPPIKADLPAKKAEVIGRGTSRDEDSPFDPSNRAEPAARALLDDAEKAFADKHYARAAQLYARVNSASPALLADCQERWAYCKLHAVAEALNKGGRLDETALQSEVRQALSLARSPRLEAFGQGLLKKLRGGDAATAAIKHTPRQGTGWAVAETAHFRLHHTTTDAAAEALVKIAEAARVEMARRWFGEAAGEWSPRCDIYVHATAEAYAKATGRPTEEPGHSTFEFARGTGRVLSRRVNVRLDDPDLHKGTLRHETTHVVLAGRFGAKDIPRWADEGIAVLSEPAARVKQHTGQLAALRRDGQLFRVAELLAQDEAPPSRRLPAFYAQSVSLVDFLVRKKDEVTFTRFVQAAGEKGYDAALERYYGYKGVAELERDWQAAALGGEVVAARRR